MEIVFCDRDLDFIDQIFCKIENIPNEVWENEKRFSARARGIGNDIYELSVIRSGFISKGAIRAVASGDQKYPTEEHYYNRQGAGTFILNYVKRQMQKKRPINKSYIIRWLNMFRMVHLVSAEENRLLDQYTRKNKNDFGNWKKAYEAVGIELIAYQPRKPYKKYIEEGLA
jgi:hypothetical protein